MSGSPQHPPLDIPQDAEPLSEFSDERLLAAFSAGDDAALGELAGRYESMLIGLARGMLGGSETLARDAVQDAWLRVIRSSATYDGRASVKTWIYQITINRCKDLRMSEHARSKRERKREKPVNEPPTRTEQPLSDAIRDAVNQLDTKARDVVLLCYHRGLTHTQAAEVLDIPVGTLKSRLHSALKALRNQETLAPAFERATTQQVSS